MPTDTTEKAKADTLKSRSPAPDGGGLSDALSDPLAAGATRALPEVTALKTQDGGNCGLFSMLMAAESLGSKDDGMITKLKGAADEVGSEVGELFSFSMLQKVASKVGYKANKVEFDGKDGLKGALNKTTGAVLIAYSFTMLNGMDDGAHDQSAHWSVITNYDDLKDEITIANPHGKSETFSGEMMAKSNAELKGAAFDWDKFKQSNAGVKFDSGHKVDDIGATGAQSMDLGGFLVDFSPA